ncbi:uncharacterized protein LOC119108244 [Pollicipes pollicipes]|uniref:uncharacterized protein LOC119108244 n=1 Tax=Pollicipes pollicipes TaxID=41117 RepID=UPI00188492A8|nr:uncharacterized protein LOC119108244 [Pollicipes pollicipes]
MKKLHKIQSMDQRLQFQCYADTALKSGDGNICLKIEYSHDKPYALVRKTRDNSTLEPLPAQEEAWKRHLPSSCDEYRPVSTAHIQNGHLEERDHEHEKLWTAEKNNGVSMKPPIGCCVTAPAENANSLAYVSPNASGPDIQPLNDTGVGTATEHATDVDTAVQNGDGADMTASKENSADALARHARAPDVPTSNGHRPVTIPQKENVSAVPTLNASGHCVAPWGQNGQGVVTSDSADFMWAGSDEYDPLSAAERGLESLKASQNKIQPSETDKTSGSCAPALQKQTESDVITHSENDAYQTVPNGSTHLMSTDQSGSPQSGSMAVNQWQASSEPATATAGESRPLAEAGQEAPRLRDEGSGRATLRSGVRHWAADPRRHPSATGCGRAVCGGGGGGGDPGQTGGGELRPLTSAAPGSPSSEQLPAPFGPTASEPTPARAGHASSPPDSEDLRLIVDRLKMKLEQQMKAKLGLEEENGVSPIGNDPTQYYLAEAPQSAGQLEDDEADDRRAQVLSDSDDDWRTAGGGDGAEAAAVHTTRHTTLQKIPELDELSSDWETDSSDEQSAGELRALIARLEAERCAAEVRAGELDEVATRLDTELTVVIIECEETRRRAAPERPPADAEGLLAVHVPLASPCHRRFLLTDHCRELLSDQDPLEPSASEIFDFDELRFRPRADRGSRG